MRKTTVLFDLLIILALAVFLSACHKTPVPAAIPAPAGPEAAPPPPLPPTCSLTAEPATIEQGKSVTLTWSSNNATALDLEPTLGKQEARGSITATPVESTTYTLSVTGPSGSGTCTARVTVTPAVNQPGSVSESNLPPGGTASPSSPLQDIFFDFNQSSLRPEAEKTLTQDADYLKAHPDAKIRIEGHCDQRGSEEYNLGLGDRRATTAKNYMVNLGISADRIATLSYGKDRLFCTETTEDCYQQNRRDHVVLLPMGE
jgi:peptidoglycan-associated lipoprotein